MEASQDEPSPTVRKREPSCDTGRSTSAFLLTVVKKLSFVGFIYWTGYMNWSIAWIVTPILLSETREYLTESNNVRRKIAKESAKGNERGAILARIRDLPSWVYFPDFERCEWMNNILQQMWPFVDEYFSTKIIKDKLEPKIRKALSKLKLNGFEFDRNRIMLGTTPIRIGGIKVHDLNTSRDEIIVDMDLIFASDCSINFRLAGIPSALNDFEIYGKVRVILKPLISKAPFVGGIQVFFLDNPDINFSLAGPAEISNIPGLSDILRRIIVKKITKKMVAPNRISKKLSKSISPSLIKMNEPEGVLRIHIAEANNLIKQDITLLGGKSDPYAVVTVGAQQFRTPTIHDNLNPVWDYYCEALIDVKSQTRVQIHLFDWDRTGGDDPLGSAKIDLGEIIKHGVLDTWIPLDGVEHGDVHLRFAWFELTASSNDLPTALADIQSLDVPNMSSAVLTVYLDSAVDLPQIHTDEQPDPFAVLEIGNTVRFTSVKKETDAPVWEQSFTFLVPNPEHDTLNIKVCAQTSSKKHGESIGQFTYNIRDLLTQTNMASVLQSFQLKKSATTSSISLSMALKILKRTGREMPPIQLTRTTSLQRQRKLTRESSSSTSASEADDIQSRITHQLSTDACMGLGSINLSLQYNSKQRVLSVTIHKIINIPMKDPSDVPDPYVILFLLPKRSKETKRKTIVVKNSCDPVFESTFEYGSIALSDLRTMALEVTVKSKMNFLSGGSLTIGMTKISLDDDEIIENKKTGFYDLMREVKLR